MYVVTITLAFAVAAGVGAIGALMWQGTLGSSAAEQPQPRDQQQDVPRVQQDEGAVQQKEDTSQQREAEYVVNVDDIQAKSVETFLDSHDKLLRYDALTADDVEEMQANQDDLQGFAEQVGALNPPQRYKEQYETFRSAIEELHEATQLAYTLVANPTAATKAKFDKYDRRVDEAAGRLQQSNEILGRDHRTIGDVQEISPL
jgi:hypothetical protein